LVTILPFIYSTHYFIFPLNHHIALSQNRNKKNILKMASMMNTAFNSITSWMTEGDTQQEDGDYNFYCDSPKLIEMILEKARERHNCVDVEPPPDAVGSATSPHHKCPSPALMQTSKIHPMPVPKQQTNCLTEKLLRDRAESGDLGIRVGDGVLRLEPISDLENNHDLLLLKVQDASPATLARLAKIPESCSTILAICCDCSQEDIKKIEDAVRGPSFSWKLGAAIDEGEAPKGCKKSLTDKDFDAFMAIARATVVLHVIQAAGF
jgi:hypothetical protein